MMNTFLFDLDGTLLDTAPDLAGALNTLRALQQLPPLPFETIRPWCGGGSRQLIGEGLQMPETHPDYQSLRKRYLQLYNDRICVETKLYPGILSLLKWIADNDYRWGIVTNKPTALTHALLRKIIFPTQPACIVCGDTLAKQKPDPAPLHYALNHLNATVNECLFIGDSQTDLDAAHAAMIAFVGVTYGYDHFLETRGYPMANSVAALQTILFENFSG